MRNWFIERVPRRETLLANRWLAPVAPRLASIAIWQFNRRSIARGLALGLFAGFILPIGQIVLAVLMAASVRANIMVACAATLITNPFTLAPIYYAAFRTGSFLLEALDVAPGVSRAPAPVGWASLGAASMTTFIGLMVFAVLSSILAFAAVHLLWRISLRLKWLRRRKSGSK